MYNVLINDYKITFSDESKRTKFERKKNKKIKHLMDVRTLLVTYLGDDYLKKIPILEQMLEKEIEQYTPHNPLRQFMNIFLTVFLLPFYLFAAKSFLDIDGTNQIAVQIRLYMLVLVTLIAVSAASLIYIIFQIKYIYWEICLRDYKNLLRDIRDIEISDSVLDTFNENAEKNIDTNSVHSAAIT